MNDQATDMCVNKSQCSVSLKNSRYILTVKRGAKIISDSRHLRGIVGAKGLRDTDAVQYTTKRKLLLVIANPETGKPVDRSCRLLQRIAFKKSRPTQSEASSARAICEELGADGWYVTGAHPKGESLVVLDPRRALA